MVQNINKIFNKQGFIRLKGVLDYKEDLEGSQFVIKNPNATTTCGCGSSFST